MMKRHPLIILLFALALFLPGLAQAQCVFGSVRADAQLLFPGASGSAYDVFDDGAYALAIPLTVEKASGVCEYSIGATDAGGGQRYLTNGGDRLSYNLYVAQNFSDAYRLLDQSHGAADNLLRGQFNDPGAETQTHVFFFHIPPGQIVRSGQFTDNVTLNVCQGNLISACDNPLSIPMTVAAHVPSVANLSLVDSGVATFDPYALSYRIDFGELSPSTSGMRMGLNMLVRGNNGFTVTMQSENGGRLVHLEGEYEGSVPYETRINGLSHNLGQGTPVPVVDTNLTTGPNGIVYPIDFTLGQVPPGLAAGPYRDIIILNVTAK